MAKPDQKHDSDHGTALVQTTLYRHLNNFALGVHPSAKYAPPVLLFLDALLCSLIISKVAYTEIDWRAYMEQVQQYNNGERDYTQIKGGTGPLVYPAAHVYIYWMLYHITNEGTNILVAQRLFGVLYLATLAIVMACYRRANAPLYIFPMLVLSKRLHSIFVLRLFNDCFAVFFLWVAIYMFQRRMWTLGSIAYSWGLGIKMSLLLALPAIGAMLFLAKGLRGSLKQAWLMAQVQIVIALQFLPANGVGYMSRAFEFSRKFLFEWTVNWRFLGEETFLSKEFSIALLVGHVSALALFVSTRWLRPAENSLMRLLRNTLQLKEPLANAIGMLFARSLHYQFYAYIAWSTPYLLWRSGLHPALQYTLWALQEWAWNIYPSTSASSMVVVGILIATVATAWWGTRKDFVNPKGEGAASKKWT